jgi:hypothetical protein
MRLRAPRSRRLARERDTGRDARHLAAPAPRVGRVPRRWRTPGQPAFSPGLDNGPRVWGACVRTRAVEGISARCLQPLPSFAHLACH